jgi:cytochrome P450
VLQLLIAGIDSTASLLGSAMYEVAQSPELAATLRADLSLIPAFLEECLRLETPFQGHFRVVRRATTLAGTRLEAGDRLLLLWGSANRDPRAFDLPHQLDIGRASTQSRHLAFGHGAHLCVGAGLARALSRTVVERLLATTIDIELAGPEPGRRGFSYWMWKPG